MKVTRLVWLVCLWAGTATAQTAATDAAADCPSMPAEVAQSLNWVAVRVPNMLLCRAVRADNGDEAFAMTISPDSPFKPRRGDRAETGTMDGRQIQWYRGEDAGDPKILVRETLVELGPNRILHIFMRAPDQQTLLKHEQMAQSLRMPSSNL